MSARDSPPLKCGYCGWLIGGCNNIMQHKCLQHFNEENHFLHVDDNFIITLIPRQDDTTSPNGKGNSHADDNADEKLIQAVCDRPALYNCRIPVKERSKLKKQALWQEISNVLGGILTSEDAKKRWQYLRDCFNKAKKKQLQYTPSGSAAQNATSCTNFRFYNQMTFLNDSVPTGLTVSNIELPSTSDDSGISGAFFNYNIQQNSVLSGSPSEASTSLQQGPNDADIVSPVSSTPPPGTPTPGRKKRKLSEDRNADLRSALITALQEPIQQPDAVDGFLARLGEGLRRIPYRERSQLEIKFLSMLMEVTELYQ